MADFPVSGSNSYIQYGWETSYGSVSASINKAFGHNQKLTIRRNMNTRPVYGLGDLDATKTYSGLFEGGLTVEFDLASTYFMKAVMGTVSDGGTGPFTHTYSDSTGFVPTSFSLENGINLDTDTVWKFLGCVVDRCIIEGRVGETVKVTLELKYASETWASSGIDTSPATDSEDIMVFSEGSLQIPSGTTLARVQSFRLELVRNAELIWGLGSRIASKSVWKTREWNWTMDVTYENEDMIQDLYGQTSGPLTATNPAGEASLVLTFTNGGATTALRSLVMTLTNSYITSDNMGQNVENLLTAEYTGFSLDYTSIIGTDNTSTTP